MGGAYALGAFLAIVSEVPGLTKEELLLVNEHTFYSKLEQHFPDQGDLDFDLCGLVECRDGKYFLSARASRERVLNHFDYMFSRGLYTGPISSCPIPQPHQ